MAPAPSVRRLASPPRWLLWVLGAIALAIAVWFLLRRRASGGGTLDSSGTPGPNRTASTAQEPSGGAGNVPGNLPLDLISHPNGLQEQVQAFDAGSVESPSASSFAPELNPYNPSTGLYDPVPPGGTVGVPQTYTSPSTGQTVIYNPGDYNVPTPLAPLNTSYLQQGRKLEVPV